MKKILMIAALMVATVSAKAQFEPGTFSLQPKVGFELTSISGDGSKFKPGFTAGLEGQYQINNWFGLSAGVHYAMGGCKIKDVDSKFNMNYVNIPVMAKFYVTKGLSLNAGLQLGFMTSAKLTDVQLLGGKSDVDIKDLCNKTDFSIPLSIAYEFTNGLSFEARYNAGVTNVFKDDVVNAALDVVGGTKRWDDNKNEMFIITVGYKFAL